ncbi:MAG: bacteriocin transport accessory protein [Clostridia bacterium]|nr:bacteriocin transport accessory protein [Clostridia bacterium]
MKKILAIALAMLMLLAMTACSGGEEVQKFDTSVKALEAVWNAMPEDYKFFAMGGDLEHPVDNAPGAYNYTEASALKNYFGFPEDKVAQITEVAGLFHAMNLNTFTCGAFKLSNASEMQSIAAAVKDSVLSTQWMCGFPEKLIVMSVGGEYLVSFYGNGELVEVFKNTALENCLGSKVLFEEVIE